MSTSRDFIKRSLKLLGVISSGETPSASDEADAFVTMKSMLGSWNTEGLTISQYTREVFTLIPGQAQYTMGTGGDFNTSRPMKITEAAYSSESPVVTEYPVEILNIQKWTGISQKSLQSSVPLKIYSEGSYPLEKVNVWPVPNAATYLILTSLKPISAVAAVGDELNLAPEYDEAIIYNLARRLAPEYGKALDPEVVNTAQMSKAAVKRQNSQPVYMVSDAYGMDGNAGYFNIFTGEYQ